VQISAGYNCAKISSTNVEILTNLAYTKYSEERKNKKLGFEKGVRFLFQQDIIYYEPKGVEKGKGKFYLCTSFADNLAIKKGVKVKEITETNSFDSLVKIQGSIKKLLDKSDIKDREKKELEAIIENNLYKVIILEKEKNFIRICYKKEHIEDCKINGLGAKNYKS
jgi:arsenate reductase-like glutaredoxin family protein